MRAWRAAYLGAGHAFASSLAARFPGAWAYARGGAVTPDFRPLLSDLDVTVAFPSTDLPTLDAFTVWWEDARFFHPLVREPEVVAQDRLPLLASHGSWRHRSMRSWISLGDSPDLPLTSGAADPRSRAWAMAQEHFLLYRQWAPLASQLAVGAGDALTRAAFRKLSLDLMRLHHATTAPFLNREESLALWRPRERKLLADAGGAGLEGQHPEAVVETVVAGADSFSAQTSSTMGQAFSPRDLTEVTLVEADGVLSSHRRFTELPTRLLPGAPGSWRRMGKMHAFWLTPELLAFYLGMGAHEPWGGFTLARRPDNAADQALLLHHLLKTEGDVWGARVNYPHDWYMGFHALVNMTETLAAARPGPSISGIQQILARATLALDLYPAIYPALVVEWEALLYNLAHVHPPLRRP